MVFTNQLACLLSLPAISRVWSWPPKQPIGARFSGTRGGYGFLLPLVDLGAEAVFTMGLVTRLCAFTVHPLCPEPSAVSVWAAPFGSFVDASHF